jgi:predicted transcriptional regulator
MAEESKKRSSSRKPEIRVYLDDDLEKLIRTIAAIKEASLSAVVSEALEYWLQLEEQQAIVQKHNLEEL